MGNPEDQEVSSNIGCVMYVHVQMAVLGCICVADKKSLREHLNKLEIIMDDDWADGLDGGIVSGEWRVTRAMLPATEGSDANRLRLSGLRVFESTPSVWPGVVVKLGSSPCQPAGRV